MIRRYRRRPADVDAIQNDGTDNRAMAIAAWVRAAGGMATAMPIGTVDEDKQHAYVHVENPRSQKIAAPGFWVVKNEESKIFYVVSPNDFIHLYDPIDMNPSLFHGEEPTA